MKTKEQVKKEINAIQALLPRAKYVWGQDSQEWHDSRPQPTEEEVQAKIAELEAAEPMRLLRLERNRILEETDWIIIKGLEQETDITKWKTYRQALRDLPKMITPDNSTEPLPAPTIDQQGQLMFLHWPEVPE